jgi:hypothetical protein
MPFLPPLCWQLIEINAGAERYYDDEVDSNGMIFMPSRGTGTKHASAHS